MKSPAFLLLAVFGLTALAAAEEANWTTDLAKAQALAKKENKLVLMDFTGSDWCPPCKELHKNVFTNKEFIDYAKKNLVLVLVDFPIRTPLPADQQKANNDLAKRFKVKAFPTVIVLDGDGKQLLIDEGYMGASSKEFLEKLPKQKPTG
jgi:thioredoxin-related protein